MGKEGPTGGEKKISYWPTCVLSALSHQSFPRRYGYDPWHRDRKKAEKTERKKKRKPHRAAIDSIPSTLQHVPFHSSFIRFHRRGGGGGGGMLFLLLDQLLDQIYRDYRPTHMYVTVTMCY